MPTSFDTAFLRTVGHEGGFTLDPEDAGNWTGGAKGKGALKGTKFGISAASYPQLDIGGITIEQAKAIYFSDFWHNIGCDEFPAPLSGQLFDAAVNHGPANAARFLQQALVVSPDGVIGPVTKQAIAASGHRLGPMLMRFLAHRLIFWSGRSNWQRYGVGWTRRGASQLILAAEDIEQGE